MDDSNFASPEKLATFMMESAGGLSNIFQTLGNEKRIEILANLIYSKQSLSDLQNLTGFQASMLGNHLAILSDAGLIKKLGRGIYDISIDGLELLQHMSEVYLEIKIREKQRLEYLQALIGRYKDDYNAANKGEKMSEKTRELNVRIVELAPFSYVSFHALGREPETEAFRKMTAWAEEQGYLEDMSEHPLFGFNNPNPKEGKEEYGYEVWMQVNPEQVEDDTAEIRQFDGGRYAVTTTKILPTNEDNVIPAWPRLVQWVEDNGYEAATHQCLEKALTPFAEIQDAYLDLYMPIE